MKQHLHDQQTYLYSRLTMNHNKHLTPQLVFSDASLSSHCNIVLPPSNRPTNPRPNHTRQVFTPHTPHTAHRKRHQPHKRHSKKRNKPKLHTHIPFLTSRAAPISRAHSPFTILSLGSGAGAGVAGFFGVRGFVGVFQAAASMAGAVACYGLAGGEGGVAGR